ncbi:MAG: F0F1 ATP synthase subunit epsilon, partial [Dehalococcoidia bacterium]|nr:F0F1 ATP synthase subunit epsilon [Dehalococcoidia bacterium]
MATLRLEIITAERQVFSDDVNTVVAPGVEGELGILPHHAPLITMLKPGELLIRKDSEETYLFVSGGFLEVRPDKILILADACERAEEIDIERAEAAKRRAEERLKTRIPEL